MLIRHIYDFSEGFSLVQLLNEDKFLLQKPYPSLFLSLFLMLSMRGVFFSMKALRIQFFFKELLHYNELGFQKSYISTILN